MPEITVDENSRLISRKDDIRLSREALQVSPERDVVSLQRIEDFLFQSRALPLYPGHAVASLLRRQVVRHRPFNNTPAATRRQCSRERPKTKKQS